MFINLHDHTEYSLLDGACRIPDMVRYAKEQGQTAIAVTDHGNMYAAALFCKECKAQGIKAIVGSEMYVVSGSAADKQPGKEKNHHLTLLCRNETGYKNLCKLSSLSFTEGFYIRPRTDHSRIKEYHEGLICLSGCMSGEVASKLLSGDIDGARKTALFYKDIFGDDYYIEVQDHGLEEDRRLLPLLFRLAEELDIHTVATNDAHYIRKEDAQIQRILLAVQTNTNIGESPVGFKTDEFYLKNEAEMLDLFRYHPEAVHESGKIADKCTYEMEFGRYKLPRFVLNEKQSQACGGDNVRFFRELCYTGLKKRYPVLTDELTDRLSYEIDTVVKMGFTDYYLIVWDFVRFAKTNDIPVGPGRGSGAGSLAAYCIGITDIDPIKYKLIFERFLNPERVSMPDFDIDFCYERRQEVIDYVIRKYGRDHVSMIVTFGTMAAKMAVRDITRVTGLPYSVGERISRAIPPMLHITLDEALKTSKELKELYDTDRDAHTIIDYAMMIEGMPRNTSTHAAGVVISDAPVSEYVPVMQRDGQIAAQYTMTELEQIGLLKMDFLGLRNLTVIHKCEEEIRKIRQDFSVKNIPDNDKGVFEMLSQGDTFGVFQFESGGMTDLLTKLRPENIEDLTAALSLYRPGPMDSIPKYLYNRKHPNEITYKHPCLEPILNVTYGCVVYQEQVMQICREMAGYSFGRADMVRRAMAKKKASIMEQERPEFIEGAASRGIDSRIAEEVFDELAGFASYAFNKSHAAAYSVVAYTTAYLKRYYFKEYASSLMTVFFEHQSKLHECIGECRERGIKMLPPDINESGMGFTPCRDGIRFSLSAAKNLGPAIIEKLLAEREKNGRYKNLSDIIRRVPSITTRNADALIRCGALDGMPQNRQQLLANLERIFSAAAQLKASKIAGQLDFFSEAGNDLPDPEDSIPDVPECSKEVLLQMEMEILGMYVTGHPLESLLPFANAAGCTNTVFIKRMRPDEKVRLRCIVKDVHQHLTKKGDVMGFYTFEDTDGTIEGIMFPDTYKESLSYAKTGAIIFIEGHTSTDRDGNINIICDRTMSDLEFSDKCSVSPVYISIDSRNRQVIDRCTDILSENPGTQEIIFRCTDKRVSIKSKKCPTASVSPHMMQKLEEAVGTHNVNIRI